MDIIHGPFGVRINGVRLHHIIEQAQGYLIYVNFIICVLTEQKPRGGVSSIPPVLPWGYELGL